MESNKVIVIVILAFCAVLFTVSGSIIPAAPEQGAIGGPTSGNVRGPREEVCRLPKASGRCRALFARWYYDPVTGTCNDFRFGGCDGNGNNFLTEKECATFCEGILN